MPHSHCGALAWLGNPLEISRLRCRSKSSWPLLSFRLRRAGRGAHVEIAANVGKCAEVERARGALPAAAQQFEQQRGMLLRLALAEVGAAPPPTDADDGGAEAALMPLVVGAACAGAAAAGRPQLARARLVQSLKWQRTIAREAGDERAAAAFASELAALQQSLDLEREAPRAIAVSALSDNEIHEILAARQAARLRRDFKCADRLRDQLNEQCVSVNDKTNRWDAADGRSGNIEPFTCDRKV